jgi:thermitase
MKALKFAIPVLIAVIISHLLLSTGGLGASTLTLSNNPVAPAETLTNESSLTDSALSVQFKALVPNDPYLEKQWALSQTPIREWWQSTGGSGIVVAVLDTGIDQNHEDLAGKVVTEVNLTDSPTSDDIYGHGTHVAGIIAASSNNGVGIAGIAPGSRLMNVKVAGDDGGCQASTVARGILWAVDKGANVINVSIELKEPSLELEDSINYAWSQGVVIVAAAGNEGSQSPVYPAYYKNCIAVAATKQDGTLAPLSNYGDWVDVAAPGVDIYSTLPGNSYGYKSGTSFATAYVSGLAAILFDVLTDTNGDGKLNDEVRAAIENSCQQISIKSAS